MKKWHWIAIAAAAAGLAAGGGIGVASANRTETTTATATVTTQSVRIVGGPARIVARPAPPPQTQTVTHTATVTVTRTISTPPPPQLSPTDCNGADPCPPRGPSGADGTYNCSDFDTQQQAQDYYDQVGDIDGLDANHDRVPCESLP